jgi:antitoxin YefM
MATTLTYTKVRERFAEVLEKVENEQEEVIVTRKGHEDMAIVPAAELASLKETAHLLRSPRNAIRLLTAMHRSQQGTSGQAYDLDALGREMGLPPANRKDPG